VQCLLRDLEHAGRRDAEHGEIDWLRDLGDRAVAPHPGHGHAVTVDGVRGSDEVGLDDVPEELSSDRPSATRRADDRDALGLEERLERRRDRHVVALRHALLEVLRALDREGDLHLPTLQLTRELEPQRLEDPQHLAVVGDDLRDEALDSVPGRTCGELLDEPRPDPALLKEPEEKALALAMVAAAPDASAAFAREDFAGAMTAMAKLRPALDAFFDKVTVNADDKALRENRLILLNRIREATRAVADFSKIEG